MFLMRWALVAALAALATSGPALAQFTPSKPIEIVAHGGPGSGNDLFARFIASVVEKEKLAPVRMQVANRPGGGSTTASAYMASKDGDSHTIGIYTNVWLTDPLVQEAAKVNLYSTLTPISRSVIEPALFVVQAGAPWKTLKEFVDEATAKPKTLKMSGGSITARENIVRQLIMKQTGADWAFISFPSGSERLAALLGGHVQIMMIDPAEGIEQLRAGKLRVLAQLADKRLPAFKDTPTVEEAGFKLPKIPQVRGIVGPPNIPAPALAYYEGLMKRIHATDTWKKYVEDNYFEDGFLGSKDAIVFLKSYEGDIREQMRATGAKIVR